MQGGDLSQLPAPGIGEVYRLLVRLEARINDLSTQLQSKVVTLDVYQVAHQNLVERVAANQMAIEKHTIEHEDQERERTQGRTLILASMVTASVALLVGVASILAGILH